VGGLTTRVGIAAASSVERAGLTSLLAGVPGLVIVFSGAQPADAIAHEVDVAVLALRSVDEISLPIDPGPDRTAPPLVLLVDSVSDDWVTDALHRGVSSLLPRDATAEELQAAVQAAGAGLVTLTREHVAGFGAPVRARTPAPAATETLTPREAEILGMLADGLANKEIAARLGISSHTVKTHVQSVFAKLGAETRAEAVALGVRRGLIVL
jgi:two-component system, NarL family, response regulator YdfI